MVPSSTRKRCGACKGCKRDDCGKCINCLDKPKFGGKNTRRQACLLRVCLKKDNKNKPIVDVAPTIIHSGARRSSNSRSMPERRNFEGPKMIHLFHLPPSPTKIILPCQPNLPELHHSWALSMNPCNSATLSAADSFLARTAPTRFAAAGMAVPPTPIPPDNERGGHLGSFQREAGRTEDDEASDEDPDQWEDSAVPASDKVRGQLHPVKRLGNDNGKALKAGTDGGEDSDGAVDTPSWGELSASLDLPNSEIGEWSLDQELLLCYALKKHVQMPRDWKQIAEYVPNRTPEQCKSHGENILFRQESGEDIFQILKEKRELVKLLLAKTMHSDEEFDWDGEDWEFGGEGIVGVDTDNEIIEEEELEEDDFSFKSAGDPPVNAISDSSVHEEDDKSSAELAEVYNSSPAGENAKHSKVIPPDGASRDGDDLLFECFSDEHDGLATNEVWNVQVGEEFARDEKVSKFFDLPEMADARTRLSNYDRLLLENIEMFRAKDLDVEAYRRVKISKYTLGFRCRHCAAGGVRQPFSKSFPGKSDPKTVQSSFYYVGANHFLGVNCPPCPYLNDNVRDTIKVAKEKKLKEPRSLTISVFFSKLLPHCDIRDTKYGFKMKSDLGCHASLAIARLREDVEAKSNTNQKSRMSQSTILTSRASPRSSNALRDSAVQQSSTLAVVASSRASRRFAPETKAFYAEIEMRHKRRKTHIGCKIILKCAVEAIATTFDEYLKNDCGKEAGPKTTGLDQTMDENEIRQFPDARLTEETEQAIKSINYECEECHFPLPPDRLQLFPLSDLVLLRKQRRNETLCDHCKCHFAGATELHVQHREQKLVDPWSPMVFPTPIFRLGGVTGELMTYFVSLKYRLTASRARMKDFGRIPATGGLGKFQYMVGDKSVSEKRWQWQDCKLLQNAPLEIKAIEYFALTHVAAQLPLGLDGYRIDPGFVMTHAAVVQGPHRDYQGYDKLYKEICDGGEKRAMGEPNFDKSETTFLPWVLHCPLCREGMELNYWPETRKNHRPVRIHIPFGTFLVMRVDAVHGGIFGSPGNIRLHIAFTPTAQAIAVKGQELQLCATNDKPTEEIIQRHIDLGATESGQHQRKLDLLKDDIGSYRDPKGIDDCERGFPIAYEEPGYAQRLLERNAAVWDASMVENISAEHLFIK